MFIVYYTNCIIGEKNPIIKFLDHINNFQSFSVALSVCENSQVIFESYYFQRWTHNMLNCVFSLNVLTFQNDLFLDWE